MIDFLRTEEEVSALKQQVAAGDIDQATFEARLLDMVDVAEDGYYWMYGHKTDQWFRHDGERWVVDTPPKTDEGSPQVDWNSIDHIWFAVSLVVISVVAAIVYSSVS